MKSKMAKTLLLSAMIMATAFSPMTAFAQSNETEEAVVEEVGQDGTPFSVPGNGQLLDDITDDSTKQFITVQTKNNQTFFMVIDRAQSTENVYMLSLIDEDDLSEFLKDAESEDAEVVLPNTETQTGTAQETTEETMPEEPATENKDNSTTLLVLIVVIFGGAIGGGYYFKIYKPKKEAAEDYEEGIEENDFEDDGEEYDDTEEADDSEYAEDDKDSEYDEDSEYEDEEYDDEYPSDEAENIEVAEDPADDETYEETPKLQPQKKVKRAHGRKNRMKYQGR